MRARGSIIFYTAIRSVAPAAWHNVRARVFLELHNVFTDISLFYNNSAR